MVEKKFVVDGMRLSYNGPFDITDFYKTVEEWIRAKGKEKEIKRELEQVEPQGKKIEWFIEIWEQVADYAKPIVRMRALIDNLKEVKVKKGKFQKTLNQGDVLIIFDGILETDIEGRWQQKPLFYFIRAVFDKFVYKLYTNRFEDKLAADVNELHKVLTDFFNAYKV